MNKNKIIFGTVFLLITSIALAAYPYQYHPASETSGGTFAPGDFYFNNTMMINVTTGNVGIGTPNPAQKLVVNGSMNVTNVTYATGGLVIETRTSDPASPETGRMWLITG